MTSHRHQPLIKSLLWMLIVFIAGALAGRAQTPKPGEPYRATMSTQRSYYDPPNQDKVKIEVSGDEATPITNGLLVTGAKIKNYSVTGALQLTAETPACFLDNSGPAFQLGSTNILKAQTGDGNFYVEGVGFVWQNTTSQLELSNDVHTIIQHFGAGTNAGHKADLAASQIDVRSRSAVFDTKNALVIYRDDVRVDNPRLKLTSAILTARMTQGGGSNQLDRIVAETNVVMDFVDEAGKKIHATSDKAVFARTTEPTTNDVLTLTGSPRLETADGWATADVFVFNQSTDKIQGSANCRFHSHSGLVTAGNNTTSASTNAETEIMSDNFDYDRKSGVVVFRDHVHVDNPRVKLVCDTLTAKLAAGDARTNNVENVVAEHHVAIDYLDEHGETTHASGEKAVYASTVLNGVTNKVMDLTGNPMLERTNGWITADLITVDQAGGMIRGEGNQHTIFKKQAGQPGKASPPTAADSEIFSDFFAFTQKSGEAFYSGNVRVLDPQMHLQARQMTAWFHEGGGIGNAGFPERILAETNVIIDYFTKNVEKTHATGEKLVFTHTVVNGNTNQVMELTGKPAIDMSGLKEKSIHATGEKVVYTSTIVDGKPSELVTLSGNPRAKTPDGSILAADDVIIHDCITGTTRMSKHNHIIYNLKENKSFKTNSPPALSSPPAS
jgi:lipopolysaccharide export system protein LptA